MGSPRPRKDDRDTTTRLGLPDARLQIARTAPAGRSGIEVAGPLPARLHETAVTVAVERLGSTLAPARVASLRRVSGRDRRSAWDLELTNDRGERVAVLVRGTRSDHVRAVAMDAREWAAARRMGTRYWLVLVTGLPDRPTVGAVQNPGGQVQDRTIDVEPTAYRLTWPDLGSEESV